MSDADDAPEPRHPTHLGYCRLCARGVHAASLNDDVSHRAYAERAVCQPCQDALSLNTDVAERDWVAPVLHGSIFGSVVSDSRILEAAVLQFQFDPWYGRFAYEPGDVVRAGALRTTADPLAELVAIRSLWEGRDERVLHLAAVGDPLLRLRIAHNHMVIALDAAAADAASQLCPSLRRPPLVDLSAAVPWDWFGAPLDELLRANAPDGEVRFSSALRQCACVARLLEVPALEGEYLGTDVFNHVLLRAIVPAAAALKEACGGSCH